MRKLLLAFIAAAFTVLSAAFVAAQDDQATFRVAHFSVDAGPVDVYVDGALLNEYNEYAPQS